MAGEVFEKGIIRPDEIKRKVPKIVGVPSGIEGLDELFFTIKIGPDGKPKKVPLGGIPSHSVLNIAGIPDTGKSLMVEQFALKQADRGKKVLFVTVETPVEYLISSLQARAAAMDIDWEKVEDNIVLIDAASYRQLRENIPDLIATMAYAIKEDRIRYTVIDSITGLYEMQEAKARQIVRVIYNFLKKFRQTALLVSQKRSGHEELTAEVAGGYAVSHIVDGTIVLSKVPILTKYQMQMYNRPIGVLVRLLRIDGCRVAGHDTRTYYLEITEEGLARVGEPLMPTGESENEG